VDICGIIDRIGLFPFGEFAFLGQSSFFVFCGVMMHNLWGYKILLNFQYKIIPICSTGTRTLLRVLLKKRRPALPYLVAGGLVFGTIYWPEFSTKVVFFPDNEPNAILPT
jgi:hypothetical protein